MPEISKIKLSDKVYDIKDNEARKYKGTITSISTGIGLKPILINEEGIIELNLLSETPLEQIADEIGNNGYIPVYIDSLGRLCVQHNLPKWGSF